MGFKLGEPPNTKEIPAGSLVLTPFQEEVRNFLNNDKKAQETLDRLEQQKQQAEELKAQNEQGLISLFIHAFYDLPESVQNKVKNRINRKKT